LPEKLRFSKEEALEVLREEVRLRKDYLYIWQHKQYIANNEIPPESITEEIEKKALMHLVYDNSK
jgi:hypothetical protein